MRPIRFILKNTEILSEYFKGEAKMKTENSTRFGFAQTVITPDAQAVYLDGFGERITPAEGVRDPLYVKAFVICAGSFRYALAVFDACGFEKRIQCF